MDQAAKMLNMRIKIDVWSQGLDESIRQEIRDHVQDLFCQLPPRRVWHYLKRIRYMHARKGRLDEAAMSQLASDDYVEEPEDVIANGKYP
jgi:hypothetical protein